MTRLRSLRPVMPCRILTAELVLAACAATPAFAQHQSLFPNPTLPPPQAPANMKAGEGAIVAQARYSREGGVINGGLHWRVYGDKPDQNGVFRLVKEDSAPQPTFVLPAGGYIMH